MKIIRTLSFFIFSILLLASCGNKKKDGKGKDLKTEIESRMAELTCECIEPKNKGLSKKEYEDLRDECLRSSFPTVQAEFQVNEENNPYGGMMEMMAAFDRIKDRLKAKCPRNE
jgi:hypothetical protein